MMRHGVLILAILVISSNLSLAQTTALEASPSYAETPSDQSRRSARKTNQMMALTEEMTKGGLKIFAEMALAYKLVEQPTMVQSDGGAIVVFGNKLRKYDKDLNLIKEVTLDLDTEGIENMASRLASKYATQILDMQKGMMKSMMDKAESGKPTESSAASAEATPSP